MKFFMFVLVLILWSCEDCDEFDDCDEICDAGGDINVWSAQELVADIALNDIPVEVDGKNIIVNGEVIVSSKENLQESINAVPEVEYNLGISVVRLPLITCDPFGWGAAYDWLCIMTGTKGRALGRDAAEPTIDDVGTYVESGSEDYPGDITSTTYFNANTFVNQLDTVANPAAFFGLVIANFGTEWSPILEYWCTNEHIPMCIQPEEKKIANPFL